MSKSFKAETKKAETKFVSEPLKLEKDVTYNPNVAQKRKEASDAAADIVSIIQTLSSGHPPNNEQMEYMIDRARRVLKIEVKNPNLDAKAQLFIEHLVDLFDSCESILIKKNANEDFQKFLVYFIRSTRDLSLKGREGELSPNVDRFKLESLFDDIKRVMLLMIKEREFRTMTIDMMRIFERLFTVKTVDTKERRVIHDELAGEPIEDWKYRETAAVNTRFADTYETTSEAELKHQARDQLSKNIHNLLISLSENKEFQRGATSMFSIFDYLQSDVEASGFSSKTLLTNNMILTMKYGRRIINSFLATDSFDRFIGHTKNLLIFIQKDEVIKRYFNSVRFFLERAMTDKQFLRSEEYNTRSNYLIKEGRALANEYYNLKIRNIWLEGKEVINDLKNDSEFMTLNAAVSRLVADCYHVDRFGNYRLDTRTLFQMKEVIAPLIIEQLAYLPIPHIASRSKTMDWDVDGLVFSAYDILPDHIYVDTNIRSDIKPLTEYQKELIKDIIVSDRHHLISSERRRDEAAAKVDPREFQQRVNGNILVTVKNIRSYLKDVRFSFRRKVFPKMADEGIADISLGGKGCSIMIKIDLDNRDIEHSLFTGGSVRVKISKLKINLRSTKRDGFYNFMTKVFSRVIARQIETAIAQKISLIMSRLIEALNRTVRKVPGRLNRIATSGTSLLSQVSQQLTTT